jgi:two-component sensor histidine kinase
VSNSSLHAFPDGRRGTVAVSLRAEGALADGDGCGEAGAGEADGTIAALEVADDGIGLPPGFSYARGERLGSLLITQLTRQLGGKISVGPGPGGAGTRATIRFPIQELT